MTGEDRGAAADGTNGEDRGAEAGGTNGEELAGRDPTAGGTLHWAPLGVAGLRERMRMIAEWIGTARPDVFVCDVSVEVAVLARLMGVPVVWIAQRGWRLDAPHRLAYGMSTVVAPWTAALARAGSGLPDGARFTGALSRYDDRSPSPPPGDRRVCLLLGGGGHDVRAEQIRAAARATPDWTWTAAGLSGPVGAPVHGGERIDDPWRAMAEADVVVAANGGNLVAEVAAARRPLIALPQARPFDEQREMALALQETGLAEAVARWPAADEWPGLLRRASARDPERWALLHDGAGARRLAREILDAAGRAGGDR